MSGPPPAGAYRWVTSPPEVFSGIQLLTRVIVGQPEFDARSGRRTAVFVSGYEGSPLGGLDLALQRDPRVQARSDVIHVPAVNEELAATAVWGSQTVPRPDGRFDGVVGYWYAKAPGLDRATDALRHANFVGVTRDGGAVAIVGDDPAAKSSTLPSASEMALAELCMPVLYPGSSQELIDYGRHAVALSRWCGLWTGLKIATDVADGLGRADLGLEHPVAVQPDFELDGRPWVQTQRLITLPPDSLESERDVFYGRLAAAEAYAGAAGLNVVSGTTGRAWLGLVAAGPVYQGLLQALGDLGLRVDDLSRHGIRLLHLGMLYPLERRAVRDFAAGLETVVVVEEKRPFLESAVRDCLYDQAERPAVLGKRDADGRKLVPADGELTPDRIAVALRRVIGSRLALAEPPRLSERIRIPLRPAGPFPLTSGPAADGAPAPADPVRAPYFCSGCPHNRSTLVPAGSVIGAGIGCHTMVLLTDEPNRRGLALTQMGGEGTQWIGQAPFSQAGHMFQNIGDGTLFHSGTLAIRACVAAGVDITYKILYNRAVAMTGGQTPVGVQEVPELTRLLAEEGVSRIVVCADDPDQYPKGARWARGVKVWPRERLEEAQEELSRVKGVTVLIYDQQCAAEARRLRRRGRQKEPASRVLINEAVCEGCGDCGAKSNCLSVHPVQTEYGPKTRIDQDSCNKDFSCLEGDCPSFVTIEPRRPGRRVRRRTAALPGLPEDPIPEPAEKAEATDEYSIYLTGIGGTGIVTVNALLATAAGMDGLDVTGLDQTGLSQKAGPVASHLKLSPRPGSRRVSIGGTDCWLVFDTLEAIEDKNLAMASPERTAAVVSTSEVPTGPMVRHPDLRYPDMASLKARIEARTRTGANFYLDTLELARRLVGSEIGANVLLLGAAYQKGRLPISALALEKAIESNGVAVEMNIAAFRWGRVSVEWPEQVPVAAVPVAGTGDPDLSRARRRAQRQAVRRGARAEAMVEASGITWFGSDPRRRLLVSRTSDLIAYQGEKLAADYLSLVKRTLDAERQVAPERTELGEAVMRNLFKLTAYKDEYEVARLYLAPGFSAAVAEQFPEGGRLTYHLHPPVLRGMGMDHKVKLGAWFVVVFRVLYALRFLRGTPFDPFGRAGVRRTERALVAEYRRHLQDVLAALDASKYDRSVRMARLPDMVRGYETLKLANVERYRAERDRLDAQSSEPAPVG